MGRASANHSAAEYQCSGMTVCMCYVAFIQVFVSCYWLQLCFSKRLEVPSYVNFNVVHQQKDGLVGLDAVFVTQDIDLFW